MQHIAANCPWCKSWWRLARGWFARLAADPEPRTEEPRWDSKRGGDIGNRHGGMLPPELLAQNPLHSCPGSGSQNPGIPEPRNPKIQESQNSGKWSCDISAGTPDNRGPRGLPEALNGGLGGSIKRPPGLVENGPFQGLWGVGPLGGVFSYEVCPSDSASRNRVVPRNFTVGSGSNVCNNFPMGDRPPTPPWLLL